MILLLFSENISEILSMNIIYYVELKKYYNYENKINNNIYYTTKCIIIYVNNLQMKKKENEIRSYGNKMHNSLKQ